MSPVLLARCCFGYRGGIVHVHVGKPDCRITYTVNSVSYGVNPLLSGLHPTLCY